MSLDETFETAMRMHESGQLQQAAELYQNILRANPQHAGALHLLGVAAQQSGRPEMAIECMSQAIRLDGRQPLFHHNLGEALRMQERYAEAEASYRQALRLDPTSADTHFGLGLTLFSTDRAAAAQTALEEALFLNPEHVEALNVMGNILQALDKTDAAIEHYQKALALRPKYPEAMANLGAALCAARRHTEGIEILQFSKELNPLAAATHFNLGIGLTGVKRFAEAAESLNRAIELQPSVAEHHRHLGIARAGLRQLEPARKAFQEARRLQPGVADATINEAMLLQEHGLLDEAETLFREALVLRPNEEEVHNDLGCTLYEKGLLDEAESCFRRALEIKPAYRSAHFNVGMIHLAKGELEQGWNECEWRDRSAFEKHKCPSRLWDGSSLEGRTILLRPEQGLGDMIQFARYIPRVVAMAKQVFVEVQPPLVQLFTAAGIPNVFPTGQDLPNVDVHLALMSLPKIFGTRLDNIPAEVPYMSADAELVELWGQRLSAIPGFRVGINWQGNVGYSFDAIRSIPLVEFAPLAALSGVSLISLQQKTGLEQLPNARQRFTIHDLGSDVDTDHGPFMDTAAIMRHLDLVITSDTSTAHLAGALGVPVWTALTYSPDWRWLRHRDDSPWYPSMRLFRQPKVKDWQEVFQQIAAELSALLSSA